MNTDHKCSKCLKTEPEVQFYWRNTKTGRYRRHLCKKCSTAYRMQFRFSKTARKRAEVKYQAKISHWRKTNQHTDRWIFTDSRRQDKKNKRDNDLDLSFIRECIKNGCQYCGETHIRMTLDRIDNTIGHTKSNVVPSCVRCNSIRMNMPYVAWLVVSKSVREANKLELFGTWIGRKYR